MKRENNLIPAVLLLILLVYAAACSAQEIADQRFEFKPSLTLQEKYTSNVNYQITDKKEDYVTTAIPGITYTGSNAFFGADVNAKLNYNVYAKNRQYDYAGYEGSIALRYNPDPTLTFRLRDSAVQSENPRYRDLADATATTPQYLGYVQQGRSIYLMNHLEPSVDWQFARDSNVGFSYINSIYRNQNSTFNESTTETYTPRFSYAFDQYHGVLVDYSFTKGDNTRYSDLQGQAYHGRYTYKIDLRSSVFADYSYMKRDYDNSATSYNIHSPTLGVEHAFSAGLTGLLQLGYYYSNPSRGDSNGGVLSTLKLTYADQFTSYGIQLETGFREMLYAVQGANMNFAQYYGATVTISHKPAERFTIGLAASVKHMDYVYGDRKDWLYNADLNASYQVLKWLSIFAKAGYWLNDASIYGSDRYDEFHAIIGVTATYL